MEKVCFKCGIKKDLNDFYVHPRMGDGHLNKCKECTKSDVKKYYKKKIIITEWHDKEKKRGRDKYHRLNYKDIQKPSYEAKKMIMDAYRNKYPEKILAKNASAKIKAPDGLEKHHWSYNKEHYKNVLFLRKKDHNIAHRFMYYDPERLMYRTLTGILLDSYESHFEYVNAMIRSNS